MAVFGGCERKMQVYIDGSFSDVRPNPGEHLDVGQ